MKVAAIVRQWLVLDLAEHAALSPLGSPLMYYSVEAIRGVGVGDGSSRHD
jgi:hypothetical protein